MKTEGQTGKKPKEVIEKECGCLVLKFDEYQHYEPCLPHALDHAGKMLCAAAARMDQLLGEEKSPAPKEPEGPTDLGSLVQEDVPTFQVSASGGVRNPEGDVD